VIDFRYHIVSLISVFIALAVGIALGAGPLKETIGDSLTGQVDQLRQDRDGLRTNLTAAQTAQANQSTYLAAAAPRLLDGALADRRVAVVTLGPVDKDVTAAVAKQLKASGATVSAQVAVTDSWGDSSLRSFRQALAGNLATYLKPAPAKDASTETELAEALVQGLTTSDASSPDKLAESASLMLQLLADADSNLITVADAVKAPADDVVILTASDLKDKTATAAADDVVASQVAIAKAAAARSEGSVVADTNATSGDVVSTILADDTLAKSLTTVTGVNDVTGQVSVPLALNTTITGVAGGHYGFGDGEKAFPRAGHLPLLDRAKAAAGKVAQG
jgi:hypothetical protein